MRTVSLHSITTTFSCVYAHKSLVTELTSVTNSHSHEDVDTNLVLAVSTTVAQAFHHASMFQARTNHAKHIYFLKAWRIASLVPHIAIEFIRSMMFDRLFGSAGPERTTVDWHLLIIYGYNSLPNRLHIKDALYSKTVSCKSRLRWHLLDWKVQG